MNNFTLLHATGWAVVLIAVLSPCYGLAAFRCRSRHWSFFKRAAVLLLCLAPLSFLVTDQVVRLGLSHRILSRIDRYRPGKTTAGQVHADLGRPVRVIIPDCDESPEVWCYFLPCNKTFLRFYPFFPFVSVNRRLWTPIGPLPPSFRKYTSVPKRPMVVREVMLPAAKDIPVFRNEENYCFFIALDAVEAGE